MIDCRLVKPLAAATGSLLLEVELQVAAGELLALTGPSGAGKTTLLRLLAGLARPAEGWLRVGGDTWIDTATGRWLAPQHRRAGLVFQDYALFPNLTVRQNLVFALRNRRHPTLVPELLEMAELTGLQHRYPQQLSGGQQQRVALARALAAEPRVLLLDEPLSALDASLRNRLQDYLLAVHQRYALTTILVTHDHREIMKLADRVVELREGRLFASDLPTRGAAQQAGTGPLGLRAELLAWIDDEAAGPIGLVRLGDNLLRVPALPAQRQAYQPGDMVWLRRDKTGNNFALDPV